MNARALRPRGSGTQETTALELFFDLVYVFAVTQISHLLINDLSWTGAWRAGFLLIVVWWAWIYTTWMVNWFDPAQIGVRVVILGVTFASLLMAAALPQAFGAKGLLFATCYVALQVGRNLGGALLLGRDVPLRANLDRIAGWSVASGILWLAGGALHGDARVAVWLVALGVDLLAPLVGYWTPRLGRVGDAGHPIEGGHFAERFQGFVIIALGESLVLSGATAAGAGLGVLVSLGLAVAFLEAAALWWLYFGEVAAQSLAEMRRAPDATALARDAYTYLHLPIVAGIVVAAVGTDLLIADPGHHLTPAGITVVIAGPVFFLGGELGFRRRMIGSSNPKRLTAIAVLLLLAPLGVAVPRLALGALVVGVLSALAVWEGTARAATNQPDQAAPTPSIPARSRS